MRFSKTMLSVLAMALAACAPSGGNSPDGGAPSPGPGDRHFRFTYEATIPVPDGAAAVDAWAPLPLEDPGVQRVYGLEIETRGGVRQETADPVHNNRMIHVRGAGENGAISIRWTANVIRSQDTGQGSLPVSPRHTQANALVPVDGEAAKLAQRLGTTDAAIPVKTRARTIYDDVLSEMAYDKSGEGWGRGDFHHAITVCRGNCTDFHARFIGTARASGIPTRFTMGIPMKPAPTGSYDSYHCWAHWHDGSTWQPVDISEARKVVESNPEKARAFFGWQDADRISLTFERDIDLVPKQKGPPLNYFVFPYAEADGTPVKLSKENWRFHWADIDDAARK